MAELTTWTTADLDFSIRDDEGEIPEGLFDGLEQVIVTLRQGSVKVEKTGGDVGVDPSEGMISVHLSQPETAKFRGGTRDRPGRVSAMVNLYYSNGERDATYSAEVTVLRNLHERRMP